MNFTLQLFDWFKLDKGSFIWIEYYSPIKSNSCHWLDKYIVQVCVFVCHMFSYHPFYLDFHSARIIFDVSSGFYFWNVNRTPKWHLSKMFKVAFKDVSTKNSEHTYWTAVFNLWANILKYHIQGMPTNILLQVFI